jgi:hypothetical protein
MKKKIIEKEKKEKKEKKETIHKLENAKFSINHRNSRLPDLSQLSVQGNDDDQKYGYQPFHIQYLQSYNPIYSVLFPSIEIPKDTFSLDQRFEFVDMNTVYDNILSTRKKQPIFIKFSPLLDPIRYMIGKYNCQNDEIKLLPNPISKCHPKIDNYHNASYVDGFFNFLSSQLFHQHHIIHATKFFGSYLGIQEKYKMNITDDFEYLYDSPFFHSKIGELFEISDSKPFPNHNYGSRGNKQKLSILENQIIYADDFIVLDTQEIGNEDDLISTNNPPVESEMLIYEKSILPSCNHTINSSYTCRSNNSDINDTSSEEENEEESENEEGSENDYEDALEGESEENDTCNDLADEPQIYAYIHQFPVQMICLEKCDGTLDELLCRGVIDEYLGASALLQIIMTLLIYQKTFHFTHNDLHTNNIMYVRTEEEFLYYIYEGKKYRVPTYGYIYKIIDFGRSIYKFQGKVFCSDSFAPSGDAYSQYNFEPFFNEEKPRIDPNYSFDLCRLACSIYDFIIDDEDKLRDMDDFQKTIYRWCMDDQDKNVLYKKNGEERYPNFKLYKMIARTVHRHTPYEQLKYPFFIQFGVSEKTWKTVDPSKILDIDQIPSYV